jgi:ribosome modulation factor
MAERARASAPRKRKAANGKGHNSRAGLPDEAKRLFLAKVDAAELAYDRAAELAKKHKAELANVYKAGNEDGHNIAGLKHARKLNKRDRAEVAEDYISTGDWLRLMDSPLVQLELFKRPEWLDPVTASLQGYRVGKAAGSIDECPYDPGTDTFAAWRTGYELGQEANQQSLREA